MLGFKGIRVDTPDRIGPAWDEALASDRPVVYEAITDPDVSILPPHISFEQARNFVTALIKGDPDEKGVIVESAKELFAGAFSGSAGKH
jgi:pyruvate dehydrogenase (quinone)